MGGKKWEGIEEIKKNREGKSKRKIGKRERNRSKWSVIRDREKDR